MAPLPRLAARGIENGIDSRYWRYHLGLVSAVKNDNLEMVELLHQISPTVLPYQAMIKAARLGNIRLLTWLVNRHESVVWLPCMMDAAASTGQLQVLQ